MSRRRTNRGEPEDLRAWAATLDPADQIALKATTNRDAIATLLRPLVAKVVVSNPRKTRAIAEAKVKTDKVDARILAQLLAADFLPETWVADDRTRKLRRLIMRRDHLVRQRTRLKNQVHAILSRNLVPTCPHADLFSGVGRKWLAAGHKRATCSPCVTEFVLTKAHDALLFFEYRENCKNHPAT